MRRHLESIYAVTSAVMIFWFWIYLFLQFIR